LGGQSGNFVPLSSFRIALSAIDGSRQQAGDHRFNRFSTKSDHQVLTADRLVSPHVGERDSLASYLAGDGGFPRHRSRRGFSGYQNSWRRGCADTPACFARKPIDDRRRGICTMKLIVCFGLPGALIAFMSLF